MSDVIGQARWFQRHPRFATLLISLLAILLLLLVAEGALRLTPLANRLQHRGQSLAMYMPDPVNGFDLKPNQTPALHGVEGFEYPVWSNEIGCFDRPLDNLRPDEPYVLLLGDSFTWGYAPFEDKWGTRLETMLGTRVLKCGVSGYGPRHALRKARKVIDQLGRPPSAHRLRLLLRQRLLQRPDLSRYHRHRGFRR